MNQRVEAGDLYDKIAVRRNLDNLEKFEEEYNNQSEYSRLDENFLEQFYKYTPT